MVARVWHGWTTPANADAYETMLKPELLPGISGKKGYRGSHLLRRDASRDGRIVPLLLPLELALDRSLGGR